MKPQKLMRRAIGFDCCNARRPPASDLMNSAHDFFPFDEQDGSRRIFIGCAGWSLPTAVQEFFPRGGSHLERYAAVFPAVEINSSFYRPHRGATYARWRDSVPDAFRFAAKMPKAITHELRLRQADALLEKFIGEVDHLVPKLGCLLIQLPPRLAFDAADAQAFFAALRKLTGTALVCEPRHPTWFDRAAADLLARFDIDYVAADPPVAPLPERAGAKTIYMRLHGSPEMYCSAYSNDYLRQLADTIHNAAGAGHQVWCVFDNTARGAAQPNALTLLKQLGLHDGRTLPAASGR
jgi:uncharacterized protein YecE (DUF72 family)